MEESSEEDDSMIDHNTLSHTSPDESLDEESSRSSHFRTQADVQVYMDESSSSDSDDTFQFYTQG